MPLGGTDLNLMVALRALLEEGNVTKAGAKIGKSQPAMSTALARLRRHYQDELLVREGRAEEVAELVVFLLSARASYITGAEIPVDGGHTSHGGAKPIMDALDRAARDREPGVLSDLS